MNDFFRVVIIFFVLSGMIFGGIYAIEKSIDNQEKRIYLELKEFGYDVKMPDGRCLINISNNIEFCSKEYNSIYREILFSNYADSNKVE